MLNKFTDLHKHNFKPAQRLVWYQLFRLADGKTNVVEFGYRSLAEQAGVGRNTAQRAISAFEKAGLLKCIWKSKKKGRPSKYQLTLPTV